MPIGETADSHRHATPMDWLFFFVLALSLSGNLFLACQLGNMARRAAATRVHLAVGTRLTSLSGVGTDGNARTIRLDEGDRPTVVFVYSPTCDWCKRTWPLLLLVAAQRRDRYAFVSVCLDAPSAAFRAEFAVLARPVPETMTALRIAGVPLTVVVSSVGIVERVWVGAYEGRQRDSVAGFFGVSLER